MSVIYILDICTLGILDFYRDDYAYPEIEDHARTQKKNRGVEKSLSSTITRGIWSQFINQLPEIDDDLINEFHQQDADDEDDEDIY